MDEIREALEERLKANFRLTKDTPASIAAELHVWSGLAWEPTADEVKEALKEIGP